MRIGLAGRAVMEAGRIVRMEDLTSVNIRFPREVRGAAQSVLPYLLDRGSLRNTLIVSPPQQGKTTLLRDLIRCAADGAGCLAQKCVVIDEREELWAEGFDLGRRTDVLRCAKRVGIPLAVRTLSPIASRRMNWATPWNFGRLRRQSIAASAFWRRRMGGTWRICGISLSFVQRKGFSLTGLSCSRKSLAAVR
ncbi:MAG: hypothetical protein V8Q43_01385 [Christensenellaceae bacterium]